MTDLSRRSFMGLMAAGAGALTVTSRLAAADTGPQGVAVAENIFPLLGVDCFTIGHRPQEVAEGIIRESLKAGFTFFASSATYREGQADRRLGEILTPQQRRQLHIQSRANSRDKRAAVADLNLALARQRSERFDSYLLDTKVILRRDRQHEIPDQDTFEGIIEAKRAGKVGLIGLRAVGDTTELVKLIDHYAGHVDFVSLPFTLPSKDPVIQRLVKMGLPIIGSTTEADIPQQVKLLKSTQRDDWSPPHLASRLLMFNKAQDVPRFAQKAMETKAGLL